MALSLIICSVSFHRDHGTTVRRSQVENPTAGHLENEYSQPPRSSQLSAYPGEHQGRDAGAQREGVWGEGCRPAQRSQQGWRDPAERRPWPRLHPQPVLLRPHSRWSQAEQSHQLRPERPVRTAP